MLPAALHDALPGILRRHLTDRRAALAEHGDRYALLIAAIDAALKETS